MAYAYAQSLMIGCCVLLSNCASSTNNDLQPPETVFMSRERFLKEGRRSYQQLTAQEKERLHSVYESISPGDEPPYPLDGTGAYSRPLSNLAMRKNWQGKLLAVVMVGSDGLVESVRITEKPPQASADKIVRILTPLRFKPAVCSGHSCSMEYLVDMSFSILVTP